MRAVWHHLGLSERIQQAPVRAGEERHHFRRRRPGPLSQPERAPVGGDAVSTLQ
jgi:hypothetical protein